MTDHWAEANGGLRGSTLLRLGAVAYLLAAALHVAARLLAPEGATPSDPMFMIALVVWDLTLFLLATGFFWTGIHPFLTRTGLGLGLFLYLQGGYLLLSLVTGHPYGLPPSMLTVGRTFLLAVFATGHFKFCTKFTGRTAADNVDYAADSVLTEQRALGAT